MAKPPPDQFEYKTISDAQLCVFVTSDRGVEAEIKIYNTGEKFCTLNRRLGDPMTIAFTKHMLPYSLRWSDWEMRKRTAEEPFASLVIAQIPNSELFVIKRYDLESKLLSESIFSESSLHICVSSLVEEVGYDYEKIRSLTREMFV